MQTQKQQHETFLSSLTEKRLAALLEVNSIRRNAGNVSEYIRAKKVVFGGHDVIRPELYEKLIRWIGDYVGY